MSGLFLKIINMSISASWLILAVLMIRLLLKKAPEWVNVLLWGIVAVRLLFPFSVESAFSLIPSAETISPEIMMDAVPTIHTGIPALNNALNPVISQSFAPSPGASMNPLQFWIPFFAAVWALGTAGFLVYTLITYLCLRKKVGMAVLLRDNIFQSEKVSSPFVLGIVRPRIYLPFKMSGEDREHVIAHEQAHIRRRDHWWKPLGFLLLAVYWFNPLMWLAYVMLCRDIELACDEKVIKKLGCEQRAEYTQALLSCSLNRRVIAACPLAFGEVGVKERVKSVLHYKKPAFWLIALAVTVCVAVAVCFLTDPVTTVRNEIPGVNTEVTNMLIPGTSYVSWQCLYRNPLSSSSFVNDSGCRYEIGKDSFLVISLSGEEAVPDGSAGWEADYVGHHIKESIPVSDWEWQEFPYTGEEWKALFIPGNSAPISDIHALYRKILYQPLDDLKFLLLADGDLLIAELRKNARMGKYIWSVYSLIDEANMGVAQWEYAPMLSSRLPVFRFGFNMEYTEISARCTGGELVDFDSQSMLQPAPSDTALTFPEGNALYWNPMDESNGKAQASHTAIYFTCTCENGSRFSGTIYITAGGSSGGRTIYTAALVGTGLHLSPNAETEGGEISFLKTETEGGEISFLETDAEGSEISFLETDAEGSVTEYDLRDGDLELSANELSKYVFFTNSTKIAVRVKGDDDFEGTVILRDISQNDAEIQRNDVGRKGSKVIFSGLTASRLYRIECAFAENYTVIVSQK